MIKQSIGLVATIAFAVLGFAPSIVHAQGVGTLSMVVDCDSGDTIQEAVDKSREGTDILVSGTCDTEKIRITKDRIRLLGQAGATISPPAGEGGAIAIHGSQIAVHNFGSIKGGTGTAITVQNGGSVSIFGNLIEDSASGIQLFVGSSANITSNQIEDSSGQGIGVQNGSSAFIFDTKVTNSGGVGIQIFRNGDASIVETVVENSGAGGINVAVSSSAVIQDSTVKNSSFQGIRFAEASSGEVRGSTSSDNNGDGISVDTSSYLALSSFGGPNTIERNGGVGVTCGFSGVLQVSKPQNFGTGVDANGGGKAFVNAACHLLNNSGASFPPP